MKSNYVNKMYLHQDRSSLIHLQQLCCLWMLGMKSENNLCMETMYSDEIINDLS